MTIKKDEHDQEQMEQDRLQQESNVKLKVSTGKRLLQYGLLYKKTIIMALLMLLFAVSAEVVGPLVAKQLIDKHVLGIQQPWYYVNEQQDNTVPYKDHFIIREDRLEDSTDTVGKLTIEQKGLKFYATSEGIVEEQDILLSKEQVFEFYKPEIAPILKLITFYLGLLMIAAALLYGQRWMLQTAANHIVQKIRHDVYAHTQRLPVSYYDKLAAGQVVSRITNDTETIRELYVGVLANFCMGAVQIVALYGAIFVLNVQLGLITLPVIPILIVWIYVYRHFSQKYNRVLRAKLSEINGDVNESIQGMSIIQAFRREKLIEREFDRLTSYYFKFQNKMLLLNSATGFNLLGTIRNIIYIIILVLFFKGQFAQAVTVGVLFAYIDYLNRLFNPIVGIVNQLANLEVARVSAERVFRLMEEPVEDMKEEAIPRYRGDVSFEHVSFAYKDKEYVLKDIHFNAKQGETVALVGHTGSGKSSILNLLFRFYDCEEGRILIDGVDTRTYAKQQIRQHMGIVLQDPYLFTGTIASNVSLDDPSISRERIVQALKDVGAYEMFMQLPDGIDTEVVEKGSTLSAGQRQLISFARALAFDPAILILDEATASIDSETEAIIQSALDVLKKGRTTFVIAHRLSTIRAADQILVLDRGVIVERGNHDSLMEQKGKYYLMYQLQSGHTEVYA